MWHGGFRPGRWHADQASRRAEMDHLVDEQRARQAHDNEADIQATRLAASLEDAVLAFQTGAHRFETASRKADHVEELRRVLGICCDVLADWEMLAERVGRRPAPRREGDDSGARSSDAGSGVW